jgi:hypothetical protein
MTVKELIDKLETAATGTAPDLTDVTINGMPVSRVDVHNGYIDLVNAIEEGHDA